jgi:hypothetical protein
MAREWHREASYHEGERVRHLGIAYEARMDLVRGIVPGGAGNSTFWRKVPCIAPPVVKKPAPLSVRGYITRDMARVTR